MKSIAGNPGKYTLQNAKKSEDSFHLLRELFILELLLAVLQECGKVLEEINLRGISDR